MPPDSRVLHGSLGILLQARASIAFAERRQPVEPSARPLLTLPEAP